MIRTVADTWAVIGCVPKLKIVVSFLQLWSKIPQLYDVGIPGGLTSWFDAFNFISLDLGMVFPSGCIMGGNMTDSLMLVALLPLILSGAVIVCSFLWSLLERIPPTWHGRCNGLVGQLAPKNSQPGRSFASRAAGLASPAVLLVIFCFIPSVSQTIFEMWACQRFRYRDPSFANNTNYPSLDYLYLKVSIGVRCASEEHKNIISTASGLVCLWPVAFLVLFGVLLGAARSAIVVGPASELSKAIGVLHREYRPQVLSPLFSNLFR